MTVAQTVWDFIERRDVRLMRRVHRWRAPRWFRYWMLSATRLGDGWLWYSLGIILLLFGGPARHAAVTAATLAAVAGIFLFRALKKMSRRKRPCQLEPHCWSRVLPPDQFSFPSGHAMTAFSTALIVSAFYPNLEWPLYFIAASIAISRIILGMHFLSDVIAGALLGTGLGFSSLVLFNLVSPR